LLWLFWTWGGGVSWSICLGWPQTMILLIPGSQIVRIIGVSHHAWLKFLNNLLWTIQKWIKVSEQYATTLSQYKNHFYLEKTLCLVMQHRLALNWWSSSLCPLSTEITDVYHYTWQKILIRCLLCSSSTFLDCSCHT
jgi:hypothetical protein